MNARSGETLQVPARIREACFERDDRFCRVCGKYLGERAGLHHIEYGGATRGMGGRRHHAVDNLVTLCWHPFDHGCHEMVHGRKRFWIPILQQVVVTPGVTALQLQRWQTRQTGVSGGR